jgi:hypothetical protein
MPVLAPIYVFKKLCSKPFAKTFDKKAASKVPLTILGKKNDNNFLVFKKCLMHRIS